MRCVTNKKCYPTPEIAEDALLEAHIAYTYPPNNGPVGVYHCEDCGYYHLTSRGPVNPRLEQERRDGKIAGQKRANAWEEKIKKRK